MAESPAQQVGADSPPEVFFRAGPVGQYPGQLATGRIGIGMVVEPGQGFLNHLAGHPEAEQLLLQEPVAAGPVILPVLAVPASEGKIIHQPLLTQLGDRIINQRRREPAQEATPQFRLAASPVR